MFRRVRRVFALAFITVSVALASPAYSSPHAGDEDHAHEDAEASAGTGGAALSPALYQTIVRINGMVCSFCAHGVEKTLSKLDGVDASQFGEGVFVDIYNHLVTVAFEPGVAIPFAEMVTRIEKAGYEPVRFYFRVSGSVSETADGWTINGASPDQRFSLRNVSETIEAGQQIDVVAYLEGEAARVVLDGASVAVSIDASN